MIFCFYLIFFPCVNASLAKNLRGEAELGRKIWAPGLTPNQSPFLRLPIILRGVLTASVHFLCLLPKVGGWLWFSSTLLSSTGLQWALLGSMGLSSTWLADPIREPRLTWIGTCCSHSGGQSQNMQKHTCCFHSAEMNALPACVPACVWQVKWPDP